MHELFWDDSEGEGCVAHTVATKFLGDWLEPFVKFYGCVAASQDDDRKARLPPLIASMPRTQRNKMCATFSNLARQHDAFKSDSKWCEWVLPAIAYLWRYGQLTPTTTAMQQCQQFFLKLSRLSASWLFCSGE